MDLAEFLLARIAEDEATATNRGQLAGDQWSALEPNRDDDVSVDVVGRGRGVLVNALRWETEHIARWDPARVLAECEAKRRIVQEHRMVRFTDRDLGIVDSSVCWKCHSALDAPDEDDDWTFPFVQDPWPCTTLRLLAMPYAAHEDYQPEWSPTVAV